MIRRRALVFALAAVSCAAVTVAHVGTAQAGATPPPLLSRYAPADEYFGTLKLSILGIRNQLHDIGLQYDVNHDIANAAFGKAVMTEESLRDWERKYPFDPDIARHVYLLSHLYQKFDLQEAQQKARTSEIWLISKYPHSWYAKDERRRMADRAAHPQASAVPLQSAATPFTRPALNAIAPLPTATP